MRAASLRTYCADLAVVDRVQCGAGAPGDAARLHLDEDELSGAGRDDVDLAEAGAGVADEDRVAAALQVGSRENPRH